MSDPIIPEDLKEAYAHFVDSMLHHKLKSVDGFTMVQLFERIGRAEHERDEAKNDFIKSDVLRAELDDELTTLRLKFAHLFGCTPNRIKELEKENDKLVDALRKNTSRFKHNPSCLCVNCEANKLLAQIDAGR